MKKLSLRLAVVVLSCCALGCPNTGTMRSDPYVVSHMVINQAGLALTIAEGIFNQWLLTQSDMKKIRKARLTFAKVHTLVAGGLKLAHDGVRIAEKAKETPDVVALLSEADDAWGDLRQFLSDLLDDGNHGIIVSDPGEPDDGGDEFAAPGGVGKRVLAMTTTTNPMDALPVSIIPEM